MYNKPWMYAPGDFKYGVGSPISGQGMPSAPMAVTPDMLGNPTNVGMSGMTLPGMASLGRSGGGGLFAGMSGMDKAQTALGGLQTIGGLWAAFQSAKMAKKQFQFTKKTTEANMANQIKSYNTALDDKSRSRAMVESQTPEVSAAYIEKNKLPAYRG